MGKGSYTGGSSLVGPGGWFIRQPALVRSKDNPSQPDMRTAEQKKLGKSQAKIMRAEREKRAKELTEGAAELLRNEGLSEPEIRKRLKLRRRR